MARAGVDKTLRNLSFLDLNSRVIDMKPLSCHVVDPAEKLAPAEVAVLCNHVAAHRQHA
jgi:hypothetical protein